jgi:hypothetical protein
MLEEGEGRPEVAEQTFGHHSERVGVSDTLWFHASAESVKCLPVASAATNGPPRYRCRTAECVNHVGGNRFPRRSISYTTSSRPSRLGA